MNSRLLPHIVLSLVVVLSLAVTGTLLNAADVEGTQLSVKLTVTSDLPMSHVPMDPTIDFGRLIREARVPGVLDPNSIRVINLTTGKPVEHAIEGFQYGQQGQVMWVIKKPSHREFEIRFQAAAKRPTLKPREYTPMIGVGDLVRYNAGHPRPIAVPYVGRLVDLTGDGKRDLVGCWTYAYRPGEPWSGIFCYPRIGSGKTLQFGDVTRLRYVEKAGATDYKHFGDQLGKTSLLFNAMRPRSLDSKHFGEPYMHADFADLNRDGHTDVVFAPRRWGYSTRFFICLNTGKRDAGGMPIWESAGTVEHPKGYWGPVRAVDLDQDGAIDFVAGGMYDTDQAAEGYGIVYYIRNTNPKGWPLQFSDPVRLDAGRRPCFYDVDGDERLDSVCLIHDPRSIRKVDWVVAWRKNLGGNPPRFEHAKVLSGIDVSRCLLIAAVPDGPRRGLLVAHGHYRKVSLFEHKQSTTGEPQFMRQRALSNSAVISVGDQSWPYFCDWDGDGDLDLLCGNGHGWPWIIVNEGTNQRPRYAAPERITADGKAIRILMNDVFDTPDYSHNMGYPYPAYVDWDNDGLPDLMLPNITNRIFWYKNIGTRSKPKFGPRRQLLVDGHPDTAEARKKTAQVLMSKREGTPEAGRPFYWRTGVAFADWNGDSLLDLVTLHGHSRKAVLYVQYRDKSQQLRLREWGPLTLTDGRTVDKSIVGKMDLWAESFRPVDWDADGRIDLVYSCSGSKGDLKDGGSMYLLRNVGTKTVPKFEVPQTFRCFGRPIFITHHGPHPWVGDFDGDGKPDLVACVEMGVFPFYCHAALRMDMQPEYTLDEAVKR